MRLVEELVARIQHESPVRGRAHHHPHGILTLGDRVPVEPGLLAQLERGRQVGARRPYLAPGDHLAEEGIPGAGTRPRVGQGELGAFGGEDGVLLQASGTGDTAADAVHDEHRGGVEGRRLITRPRVRQMMGR